MPNVPTLLKWFPQGHQTCDAGQENAIIEALWALEAILAVAGILGIFSEGWVCHPLLK